MKLNQKSAHVELKEANPRRTTGWSRRDWLRRRPLEHPVNRPGRMYQDPSSLRNLRCKASFASQWIGGCHNVLHLSETDPCWMVLV